MLELFVKKSPRLLQRPEIKLQHSSTNKPISKYCQTTFAVGHLKLIVDWRVPTPPDLSTNKKQTNNHRFYRLL